MFRSWRLAVPLMMALWIEQYCTGQCNVLVYGEFCVAARLYTCPMFCWVYAEVEIRGTDPAV